MTTTPEGGLQGVKASWENQLEEARHLAANFNDAAIPLYEKLYTRLLKLTPAQRKAANQRLQNIFLSAAVDYQGLLIWRGRYDEALAVVDRIMEELPENERAMWEMHATELLVAAGDADAAIARVQQRVDAAPEDAIETMGDLVLIQLRAQRVDDAAAALDALRARIDALDVNEEAAQRDRAYVADLGTTLALERRDHAAAEALFAEAMELNPELKEHLNRLYATFVRRGEPERALPYIRRDQRHPVRAAFWQGLALDQLGQRADAVAQWEKAISDSAVKADERSLLEYVLAHYYLGDPEGTGLGAVLNLLQEEGSNVWSLFFLAGLGWALRDNLTNARINLQRAVNLRRANGRGRFLSEEIWYFFADLLREDQLVALEEFFELETAANNAPADDEAADDEATDDEASDDEASEDSASENSLAEASPTAEPPTEEATP